jgi:hypothetical protein
VQILQHQHEWLYRSNGMQELQHALEDQRLADGLFGAENDWSWRQTRLRSVGAQQLRPRAVGRRGYQVVTLPRQHQRAVVGGLVHRRFDQRRLADPGVATDQHERSMAVARCRQCYAQLAKFRVPPNEDLRWDGSGHRRCAGNSGRSLSLSRCDPNAVADPDASQAVEDSRQPALGRVLQQLDPLGRLQPVGQLSGKRGRVEQQRQVRTVEAPGQRDLLAHVARGQRRGRGHQHQRNAAFDGCRDLLTPVRPAVDGVPVEPGADAGRLQRCDDLQHPLAVGAGVGDEDVGLVVAIAALHAAPLVGTGPGVRIVTVTSRRSPE